MKAFFIMPRKIYIIKKVYYKKLFHIVKILIYNVEIVSQTFIYLP